MDHNLRTDLLKVDLFDALDLKLMPGGMFLQHYKKDYVLTTFEELQSVPLCQVLNARLRLLGIPSELIEIIDEFWIEQHLMDGNK